MKQETLNETLPDKLDYLKNIIPGKHLKINANFVGQDTKYNKRLSLILEVFPESIIVNNTLNTNGISKIIPDTNNPGMYLLVISGYKTVSLSTVEDCEGNLLTEDYFLI